MGEAEMDLPLLHFDTADPHKALCGADLQNVEVPSAEVTCAVCLDLESRGITRADVLLNEVETLLGDL